MGTIQAVVGGQFGSEGKGAVAARLGRDYGIGDCIVRVAGPNAGHTAYDSIGQKFAFRQLPVASVTSPHATIVIGAGSEVDIPVLLEEIDLAERSGHEVRSRLLVDESATVLTDQHKVAEGEAHANLVARIGSTGKGIGAARSDRLMRQAEIFGDVAAKYNLNEVVHYDTSRVLNMALTHGRKVMIEGTQGYGLGLHTGFYPQTTSSDCRAIDFLSMAGVNPWQHEVQVWLVLRVYPIRVAGNSGPLENETSWAELGLPEEHTTVTKKVRRVGGWDPELARDAIRANGKENIRLALTMVDQKFSQVAGMDGDLAVQGLSFPLEVTDFLGDVEFDTGVRPCLIGTGPTTMVKR